MKRILVYSLLLALTIGISASLWTVHADAAHSDLERLLPLSEQLIASDKKIIIKHSAGYKAFANKKDFERIGVEIVSQLDIPHSNSQVVEEPDHLLYEASSVREDGIKTTLLWIGFTNGTTELVLSAEASTPSDGAAALLKLQKEWTGKLKAKGITPNWNVMIQGAAAPASSLQEPQAPLRLKLPQQLQAEEVGRYTDAGSLSISYYSPQLSVLAGMNPKEKMNLQVAVHRNSITQQQRITIGSPAISIEY